MGGKTHADNSAVVEEQKKQAANEAAQEAARQARINTGLRQINYAFQGRPVTTPTAYDWSTFQPTVVKNAAGKVVTPASALPKGYTAIRTTPKGYQAPAATPAAGGAAGSEEPDSALETKAAAPAVPAAAPPQVWAIRGPDGKIYYKGDKFTYNQPTGRTTGGIQPSFYQNYADAYHAYYDPQVAQQYKDARDELTYRLARAGDLTSSAADTETANLAQQNAQNTAMITNQADQAVANLKSNIASEKQKAISQLYATNDPTIAANQATAAVRDISPAPTDLSPLTQLFNVAAIGGANILRNFNNQKLYSEFNQTLPSGGGSGSIVS